MAVVPALYAHQEKAVGIGMKNPRWAFFMDTGTGKTRVALEIHRRTRSRRTLVVCPLSIIEPAWLADTQQFLLPFNPGTQLLDLHRHALAYKSRICRLPELGDGRTAGGLVFVNYETFRLLAERLSHEEWDLVFFDESSRLKNNKALTTKAAIAFCDALSKEPNKAPRIYVMSGTPAPNTPLEYWGQLRIICPTLLGRSFYGYRNQWFYPSGYQGHEWKILPQRLTELTTQIEQRALFIDKQDCLDLPPQVDEIRYAEMEPKQAKVYKQLARELAAEIDTGGSVIAANALVKVMRLRQITSGFVLPQTNVEMDAAGALTTPVQLTWLSERKGQVLKELLEDIGPKSVIIWVNFHAETDHIKHRLRGESFAEATGRIPLGERNKVLKRFRDGEVQYLIAHPSCIAHGITLVECDTAVYFSLSYSFEQYKQSRDRIYRAGQKQKTTYHHILCPHTIDVDILDVLRTKKDVARTVLDGLRKWLV